MAIWEAAKKEADEEMDESDYEPELEEEEIRNESDLVEFGCFHRIAYQGTIISYGKFAVPCILEKKARNGAVIDMEESKNFILSFLISFFKEKRWNSHRWRKKDYIRIGPCY